MLVRNRMSRRLVAARPTDSLRRAEDLMARNGIRHLPVLHGRRLVGIVSDRDLRGAKQTETVGDVMTLNPVSISPDASVDEAAGVMDAAKISALPVVERQRVVGILTTTGILRAFIDLCGTAELTTRIILRSPGRGRERNIPAVMHACHGELKWLHRQGRELHLRVKARDIDGIVTALQAAGFEVSAVIASHEHKRPPARKARGASPVLQ